MKVQIKKCSWDRATALPKPQKLKIINLGANTANWRVQLNRLRNGFYRCQTLMKGCSTRKIEVFM